jgi:hypothetical protein
MTTSASPAAPPSQTEPSEAGLPSQNARTIVNLLLFVHLFSLGAMCLFNGSEMGLREQLRRVPGYYLQLLGMDLDFESGHRFNWQLQARDRPMVRIEPVDLRTRLGDLRRELISGRPGSTYEAEKALTLAIDAQRQNVRNLSRRGLYHLTHGDALDVGHFLEFSYHRDGADHVVGLPGFHRTAAEDVAAGLPAVAGWQGFWPRQRYLRYQLLAREVGRLAGQESLQDILPSAIVAGILQSEGISPEELGSLQPRFYCRRLMTRSQPDVEDRGPMADPWHERWFVTAYQKTPVAVGSGILLNDTSGLPRDYAPTPSTADNQEKPKGD